MLLCCCYVALLLFMIINVCYAFLYSLGQVFLFMFVYTVYLCFFPPKTTLLFIIKFILEFVSIHCYVFFFILFRFKFLPNLRTLRRKLKFITLNFFCCKKCLFVWIFATLRDLKCFFFKVKKLYKNFNVCAKLILLWYFN